MAGKKISPQLSQKILEELSQSINSIHGWGSIEIIIQNNQVTQITEKNIRKPIISLVEE